MLFVTAVKFGYGEKADTSIQLRFKTMVKSEHLQIIPHMIDKIFRNELNFAAKKRGSSCRVLIER